MPLYDFQCHACNKVFSQRLKIGETTSCPFCGGEAPEKLVSAFAFSVKGQKTGSAGVDAASVSSSANDSSTSKPAGHVHGSSCGCGATQLADSLIKKHLD